MEKGNKVNSSLTKDKVEVYGLFGDLILKWFLSLILTGLFIAVLIIMGKNISKGNCSQIWWLTLINVTLGFGLRTMFKHFFK